MHRDQRDARILRPGHFIGLKWDEGWWFLQILGTSVEELKPWVLLNENGNRAEIAATTAGNQDEIRDENNRLQLEPNDDERGLVFQILTGINPSRAVIVPEFGREQNLGLEQNIQPGDDEMWLQGFDSPYNNPSEQSEIIYVNDMAPLRLTGYNPMDEATEIELSFFVNKLHYATVTDVNMMKGMLQNQITSKKHMMGLGPVRQDQLSIPEWLESAFGEHITPTDQILDQGDTSQITGDIQIRQNVQLASAESRNG